MIADHKDSDADNNLCRSYGLVSTKVCLFMTDLTAYTSPLCLERYNQFTRFIWFAKIKND